MQDKKLMQLPTIGGGANAEHVRKIAELSAKMVTDNEAMYELQKKAKKTHSEGEKVSINKKYEALAEKINAASRKIHDIVVKHGSMTYIAFDKIEALSSAENGNATMVKMDSGREIKTCKPVEFVISSIGRASEAYIQFNLQMEMQMRAQINEAQRAQQGSILTPQM